MVQLVVKIVEIVLLKELKNAMELEQVVLQPLAFAMLLPTLLRAQQLLALANVILRTCG